MKTYARYAIYYAPADGDPLATFGAAWLGWDAGAGRKSAHPQIDGLPAAIADITRAPRKYGFHATLKAPFRLAGEPTALVEAVRALAARHRRFEAPPLRLTRLGRFVALVPNARSDELDALAFACVSELDAFRSPSGETELAKRRAARLTAAQEAMLVRWGYPFVGREFRFHLTLTGSLAADAAAETETALTPHLAPILRRPMDVRDICLFGESPEDGQFRIVGRFPLAHP